MKDYLKITSRYLKEEDGILINPVSQRLWSVIFKPYNILLEFDLEGYPWGIPKVKLISHLEHLEHSCIEKDGTFNYLYDTNEWSPGISPYLLLIQLRCWLNTLLKGKTSKENFEKILKG